MPNNPYNRNNYKFEGKYDSITTDGFGTGSSYKTIYRKGEKSLENYIRQQNQAVALPPEDEELSGVQPTHRRGWSQNYKLPVQAVPPEAKQDGVLPREGEDENNVLKH